MNEQQTTQYLAAFGYEVLCLLQDTEDWSSETIEQIAESAIGFDLASTDEKGMFAVNPNLHH